MKILSLILLVGTLAVCDGKQPSDDTELTRNIVGSWETDPPDKNQTASTSTYNADDTGSEIVRLPDGTYVLVTTHWSIKKGILTLKNDTSTDTKLIPIGIVLKDRIVEISETRFVYESYEGYGKAKGKRETKVRKK